ncbi:hypothetical protein H2O64_13920 [Kordia sp. YSTF-M3]|uniref:PH domain-containing protein n=1 Tax=Kordia aestuariivivens TaxID=2759037 RepID=A0ABR7QB42_9FLAO|nr:hypothetical protein [Kordia aestuariivivens]MBC8755769.1 hypothetical protein [Kordia aestuariivivens]
MNEEFQIRENGFNEIKKGIIIKTIPLAILSAIVGVAISEFNSNKESSDTYIYALLFLITLIIGAITFGVFKGIKRQRILFESYKLTITSSEIIRERHATQTVSIPLHEIKSIVKSSKGIFMIVGSSTEDVIDVPLQINNPERLEQILTQIQPISDADERSFIIKYKYILLGLLMLGLMASVYLATNKVVVGIAGTALTLFLVYAFLKVLKSKHIDKKTKKGMWWILLVLFSILGTMYMKLTGKM